MLRAVVDTNVLMEGVTQLGSSARVIDAWVEKRFQPCVSTALALEYREVFGKKLAPPRGRMALRALQALLDRCEWVPIWFTYRPSSPDPGDELVIDCVMNSQAVLVTRNSKHFREASKRLGFQCWNPEEFLEALEGGAWGV